MQPPGDRQPNPGNGVVVQLAELMALQYGSARPRLPVRSRPQADAAQSRTFGINSQGLAYAGSRPHQNGDDIRAVDWRQTARRGRLYTKQFAEEHERPVLLMVDMGTSMRFGTRVAFKSVTAARAAGFLAWQITGSGERVGGMAWTGHCRPPLEARYNTRGLMPLLKQFADASAETPSASSPGIHWPLQRMADKVGTAAVIVISDFAAMTPEAECSLRACARRAHLVMIHVHDPFERNPPPGIYRLNNGCATATLNLHPGRGRQDFIDQFAKRAESLQQLARATQASYLAIATDSDLPGALQGVCSRSNA